MTPRMAERLTSLLVCRDSLYSSVFFFRFNFTRFFFYFIRKRHSERRCTSTRSADHRNVQTANSWTGYGHMPENSPTSSRGSKKQKRSRLDQVKQKGISASSETLIPRKERLQRRQRCSSETRNRWIQIKTHNTLKFYHSNLNVII